MPVLVMKSAFIDRVFEFGCAASRKTEQRALGADDQKAQIVS